jgi:F420H(2)-dependent quinone reductase
VRYKEANPIQRFIRWSAATAPVPWLYVRVLHHIDRPIYRLTRGRHTAVNLVSGLPVVMLTTTGAKTGQQRVWPVLGIPDGDKPDGDGVQLGAAPSSRLVLQPARPSGGHGHRGRDLTARPGP